MRTADAKSSSGHASRPAEPFFKSEGERGFFSSPDAEEEILRKPAFESDEDVPAASGERIARRPAGDNFLGGLFGDGLGGSGSSSGTGGGDGTAGAQVDVADVQLAPRSNGPARSTTGTGSTVLGNASAPFFSAASGAIQPRLAVNEPGDRYEREAEAMAERAVHPSDRIRALPPADGETRPNVPGADGAAGLPALQRRSEETPAVSSDLEGRLRASKGKGRPLDSSTREEMETSFGADFGEVRVHTGDEAARMSNELGAEAFTHGGDIYFNERTYRPETTGGKRLLAHELTHTVQQGASVQKTPERVSGADEDRVQRVVVGRAGRERIQRGPLSSLINKILRYVPGWTLLTLIIGTNPVTGENVPRTPTNIIDAILGLIPGGVILADKLKKTGALAEAGNWLSSEIDKLGISVSYIKNLISKAWDQLSIWNSWSTNLAIVKRIFGEPYRRIKAFAGRIATKIKEFIFRGALKLVGAPVGTIMSVLNKGREVLGMIIADPIGFMKNLGRAVGGGIKRFVANIKQHLLSGLISWLTGAMSGLPITLPAKWDLKGILHLVLQVLGLTWNRIREKLVKRVGEKVVSAIEKGVEIVQRIRQEGPIALWNMIKEKAAEIKTQIMEGIRNWVITNVVKQAVIKLLSFINPAGALVQAVLGLYNLVMFLYENMSRIIEFVRSVFNSIGEIARGAIGKAVEFIHRALAQTVPVILSFLARLLGLGNVGKAVTKVIKKIRKPVDRVVDKALDFIVKKGKALFSGKKGSGKAGKFTERDRKRGVAAFEKQEKRYLTNGNISKEEAEKVASTVKKKHRVFKSITVVDGGDSWDYKYVFRATGKEDTPAGKALVTDRDQAMAAAREEFGDDSLFPASELYDFLVSISGLGRSTVRSWKKKWHDTKKIFTQTTKPSDPKAEITSDAGAMVSFDESLASGHRKPTREPASKDDQFEGYKKLFQNLSADGATWKSSWASEFAGADEGKKAAINRDVRQTMRDQVVANYGDSLEALNENVLTDTSKIPPKYNKIRGMIFEEWLIDNGSLTTKHRPYFYKDSKNGLKKNRQPDGAAGTALQEAKALAAPVAPKGDQVDQIKDYAKILTSPKIPWIRAPGDTVTYDSVEYHFNDAFSPAKWFGEGTDGKKYLGEKVTIKAPKKSDDETSIG